MSRLKICKDCIKDEQIKLFFDDATKKRKGKCVICGENTECIGVGKKLINLTRLLIRYHYPEYIYNSHHGGNELYTLMSGENELYKASNDDEFNDIITGGLDTEEKIRLFAGHSDYGRGCFLSSIKERKSDLSFFKKVEEKNSYLLEDEFIKKMSKTIKIFEKIVCKESHFYRARIGGQDIELIYSEYLDEPKLLPWSGKSGFYKSKEYEKYNHDSQYMYRMSVREAYKDSEIGAPPVKYATSGRVNKAGVSFLYLASDAETAISEVKPTPGQYASVGMFNNIRDLKVIDITMLKFYEIVKCEEDITDLEFLLEIQSIFDKHALPEEKNPYLITQFIAEQIRKMGYDGISFRSVVGNGINSVFFNPEDFKFVPGSDNLVRIDKMSFEYSTVNYQKTGYGSNWLVERLEKVTDEQNSPA